MRRVGDRLESLAAVPEKKLSPVDTRNEVISMHPV
jgi:hypothetical protein